MGLTSFNIMFGSHPPNIPNLQTEVITELLEGIQWVHKHIRPKPQAPYETGTPPEPPQFLA